VREQELSVSVVYTQKKQAERYSKELTNERHAPKQGGEASSGTDQESGLVAHCAEVGQLQETLAELK
jgi:hypothetical protein